MRSSGKRSGSVLTKHWHLVVYYEYKLSAISSNTQDVFKFKSGLYWARVDPKTAYAISVLDASSNKTRLGRGRTAQFQLESCKVAVTRISAATT